MRLRPLIRCAYLFCLCVLIERRVAADVHLACCKLTGRRTRSRVLKHGGSVDRMPARKLWKGERAKCDVARVDVWMKIR